MWAGGQPLARDTCFLNICDFRWKRNGIDATLLLLSRAFPCPNLVRLDFARQRCQ
jgi:hypothetical protein